MRLAKILILLVLCLAGAQICPASETGSWKMPAFIAKDVLQPLKDDEQELDGYCLRLAYPQIAAIEKQPDGSQWLLMADGRQVPFVLSGAGDWQMDDNMPVAHTMAELYNLEPERPDLAPGQAPGRKRSRFLLEALYGNNASEVMKGLVSTKFRGRKIALSRPAGQALAAAIPELEALLAEKPHLAPWLVPEGGFYWRKIAGENPLSPHSYGIAVDFGVKIAPYWRWARINPHPKQKSYPGEIVRIMEDNGFIWGGKWHEYDLMHFEYRPELVCKARIKAMLGGISSSFPPESPESLGKGRKHPLENAPGK